MYVQIPPQIPSRRVILCGGGGTNDNVREWRWGDGNGETRNSVKGWRWGVFEGVGEDMSQQTHHLFSELASTPLHTHTHSYELVFVQAGWRDVGASGGMWHSLSSSSPP